MSVVFDHLFQLSDAMGTFEHADHSEPRIEHGYCVDDVARVLIAACHVDGDRDARLAALENRSLEFVVSSMSYQGEVRNRRNAHGEWTSEYGTGDWWGRALWSLGVCSQHGETSRARQLARRTFTLGAQQTSTSPRALAFATLGAVHILSDDPAHPHARARVADFIDWFDGRPSRRPGTSWPWPEDRLAYANAVICDALIAAGHAHDRLDLVHHGLELLSWLIDRQTIEGHLSMVPVGGAGPGDTGARFDQQPIEVARLADACERAFGATVEKSWIDRANLCADWFNGRNDLGVAMWQPETGAGFDGLTPSGPNRNQGAESTLAAITTAQVHQRLRNAGQFHSTGN